jgi:hypothetical protein
MIAAVVILIDSIRGWLGLRKRPEPVSDLAETAAS